MGPDMVNTPGPWELYTPSDDPKHLLRAHINATAALLGLLCVSIGIFVGGDTTIITIVAIISLMMAVLASIRYVWAAQSKRESELGGNDGRPFDP